MLCKTLIKQLKTQFYCRYIIYNRQRQIGEIFPKLLTLAISRYIATIVHVDAPMVRHVY